MEFFKDHLIRFKKNITNNLLNLPGWRTNRKIVVIESDDWGSIRMPSREVFNRLNKEGYRLHEDHYMKYDCLESEKDLEQLFDVLLSVRDKNDKPAVITANYVTANPDFNKIKQSDFTQYFYEPFTETFKGYSFHQNSLNLIKEGMKLGIFFPQFHGREHVNVTRWINDLKSGNKWLIRAFENQMISISSLPSELKYYYMESFDYFSEDEKYEKEGIIEDGLKLFEQIFGYKSKTFIANCYIWGRYLENTLYRNGVRFIQGISNQIEPFLKNEKHSYRYIRHYLGEGNQNGQIYLIRNAFFEPSGNPNFDSLNDCLRRINIAFKWKKPAIIGSHRVNYIGGINVMNRENTLKLFKLLLQKIIKIWPDVEFLNSEELGNIILNENMKSYSEKND